MDGWLKQSIAITLRIGPFLDSVDGNTQETALTIAQADVVLSKTGGALAAKNDATSCTHDSKGYYSCPLNATDTGTLGLLKLAVHVAGALAVWHTFMVVSAQVWDSLFGADKLDVAVVEQANIDFGALQKASLNAATPASITGNVGGNVSGSVASVVADVGITQVGADKVWGTAARALTDKADFALSAASRNAIWDDAGAITSISFETLLERLYEMVNNKMNVTDATGVVALRNIGNTGTIATGSVTDDLTTTVREELTWV